MKYLIWRSKVKTFIEQHYDNHNNWESWVIWRDLFIENKSPELAATEAYKSVFG